MKLKKLLEEKPDWVESINSEFFSHDTGKLPITKIVCIGRKTPIPELEELILDAYNTKHLRIDITVNWSNYNS